MLQILKEDEQLLLSLSTCLDVKGLLILMCIATDCERVYFQMTRSFIPKNQLCHHTIANPDQGLRLVGISNLLKTMPNHHIHKSDLLSDYYMAAMINRLIFQSNNSAWSQNRPRPQNVMMMMMTMMIPLSHSRRKAKANEWKRTHCHPCMRS